MSYKRLTAAAFIASGLMLVAAPAVSAESATDPTVCYDAALDFEVNDIDFSSDSADCVSVP